MLRFVLSNNIDKNTLGLHIRASDFPSRDSNIEFAKNFIDKNQDKHHGRNGIPKTRKNLKERQKFN